MVTRATALRRAKVEERLANAGISLVNRQSAGRNKFNAHAATYKGEVYDSAGEALYAQRLDLKCKAGELTDWWRPDKIGLTACVTCGVEPGARCRDKKQCVIKSMHQCRVTYKPDFCVIGAQPNMEAFAALKPIPTSWYIDYKGSAQTETEAFWIKVRLWRLAMPYELRVAYPDGSEKVVATGKEAIEFRIQTA
jgi:Zn ribbon nucleic-acid-binding protein